MQKKTWKKNLDLNKYSQIEERHKNSISNAKKELLKCANKDQLTLHKLLMGLLLFYYDCLLQLFNVSMQTRKKYYSLEFFSSHGK